MKKDVEKRMMNYRATVKDRTATPNSIRISKDGFLEKEHLRVFQNKEKILAKTT